MRVRGITAGRTSPASNEIVVVVGGTCTAAPPAPSRLAAAINGSTLTLTWNPSHGATSYELMVGSAPGQADLASVDTDSGLTTLTAADVTAGTYYVSVRGSNACGVSAASNELGVVIR
jgi:hypothetical protein